MLREEIVSDHFAIDRPLVSGSLYLEFQFLRSYIPSRRIPLMFSAHKTCLNPSWRAMGNSSAAVQVQSSAVQVDRLNLLPSYLFASYCPKHD